MLEAAYQRSLVNKLRKMFPGCEILENDAAKIQGISDLLILFQGLWAMLEVKASANSPDRPNQEYWINHYNEMSFAAFIYPENEEQVLRDLQHALGVRRQTRLPQSKQLPLAELQRPETGSPILRRKGGTTGNRSTSSRSRVNSSRRKAG